MPIPSVRSAMSKLVQPDEQGRSVFKIEKWITHKLVTNNLVRRKGLNPPLPTNLFVTASFSRYIIIMLKEISFSDSRLVVALTLMLVWT